jgi:hypothetical protein
MSDGDTPLILPAWPIFAGFIFDSFCLPSVEIEVSVLYSISSGISSFSNLLIFSAITFSRLIYPSYFNFISAPSNISSELPSLSISGLFSPFSFL